MFSLLITFVCSFLSTHRSYVSFDWPIQFNIVFILEFNFNFNQLILMISILFRYVWYYRICFCLFLHNTNQCWKMISLSVFHFFYETSFINWFKCISKSFTNSILLGVFVLFFFIFFILIYFTEFHWTLLLLKLSG